MLPSICDIIEVYVGNKNTAEKRSSAIQRFIVEGKLEIKMEEIKCLH